MGEEFETGEVDVRQRKSGKNKIHEAVPAGEGESVHGSSKRRKRGRGDKPEVLAKSRLTAESQVFSENIEQVKKGKVYKVSDVSVDDSGDDDDSYDQSLEDDESSGSWLFKLIIIAIIVSLGGSLMWFNDAQSSTHLDDIDSDSVESIVDSYAESSNSDESDDNPDRGDIDSIGLRDDTGDANSYDYQEVSDSQLNEDQNRQSWYSNDGQSDPMAGEIISEVSENLGQSDGELNDGEPEPYRKATEDQGYTSNEEPTVVDQQPTEAGWFWNVVESVPVVDIPASDENVSPASHEEISSDSAYFTEQSSPSFDNQEWQYQQQQQQQQQYNQNPEMESDQSQVENRKEQHQQFEQFEQHEQPKQPEQQEQVQYEPIVSLLQDEQAGQFLDDFSPPMAQEPAGEAERFECPDGSHWDGSTCVNSASYGQIYDNDNNNNNNNYN